MMRLVYLVSSKLVLRIQVCIVEAKELPVAVGIEILVSFEDTPTIRLLSFVDPLVHFVAPPFRTIQSTLSVFSYFAYAEAVYLVGNQSDWKTSEDYVHMIVLPPKIVKRVGRPKKKRIPSVGEAPKLQKYG
ncbi:MuDRA-like transposase [Cucumis melo var. makuwa]|uniref:MuDRA-like transposase n=1 Tax=Cucumis melo var. makuwa TaxID=1194695 RepID=A0A5D3DY92_CUCMM|nr:MuDRA-like transposase [Cucumis melo var. makuwa]